MLYEVITDGARGVDRHAHGTAQWVGDGHRIRRDEDDRERLYAGTGEEGHGSAISTRRAQPPQHQLERPVHHVDERQRRAIGCDRLGTGFTVGRDLSYNFV